MKDKKHNIVDAIKRGIIHEITGTEICHPMCGNNECTSCVLGASIGETDMDKCLLCGSTINRLATSDMYTGHVNYEYACGTVINACKHWDGRGPSMTSILIGDRCYGISDEDDII